MGEGLTAAPPSENVCTVECRARYVVDEVVMPSSRTSEDRTEGGNGGRLPGTVFRLLLLLYFETPRRRMGRHVVVVKP